MENKSPVAKKLNDLGFSEAEALVYIFLVNNGASSIQTVTDAVALPRSTVNLSIETLVKRGIVSFFTRGKRKNYVPRPLENLMNYLIPEEEAVQKKKKTILSLIPDLESMFYLKTANSEVEFLEGEEGLKKLYNLTLENSSKEILRLSIASEKFNFIPEFLKDYVERKNNLSIKTRLILPRTEFSKTLTEGDQKDNRETRFLDRKMYDPDIALVLWDENVAITTWDKSLKTTLWKSKMHSDFFKNIFEILWSISSK